MGYDIYIGEAKVERCEESGRLRPTVDRMEHADAPVFPGDDMTGRSNARHPGYSQWGEFCRAVGLNGLFFGDTGLMAAHPGCVVLTQQHLDDVRLALTRLRSKHPKAIPGWDPNLVGITSLTGEGADPKYDGNMARLMWLEWWFEWALINCKTPAIFNR